MCATRPPGRVRMREWDSGIAGACSPIATLDGEPIIHALIAETIWSAITGVTPIEEALDEFGAATIPREIYPHHLDALTIQARQMSAICKFVREHDLRWAPAGEPEQRYPTDVGCRISEDEATDFYTTARNDYREYPEILAGLDAYAREVAAAR